MFLLKVEEEKDLEKLAEVINSKTKFHCRYYEEVGEIVIDTEGEKIMSFEATRYARIEMPNIYIITGYNPKIGRYTTTINIYDDTEGFTDLEDVSILLIDFWVVVNEEGFISIRKL